MNTSFGEPTGYSFILIIALLMWEIYSLCNYIQKSIFKTK